MISRKECPLTYLDLSARELELLDALAVAFAHTATWYGSVWEESLWTIADRRAILSGEKLPDRWNLG